MGKEDIRIEDRPVPEPESPDRCLSKLIMWGSAELYSNLQARTDTDTTAKDSRHEQFGTIVKLGEGVTDFQVGQRVLCGTRLRTAKKTALHVRKAKQTSVSTDFRELPVSECRMAVTQNIC